MKVDGDKDRNPDPNYIPPASVKRWVWDDHDEYGTHYNCPKCKCGIFVSEQLKNWTPDECPSCGTKLKRRIE